MYYDFLGNEIKAGMTVRVIRTRPMWSAVQAGCLYKGRYYKVGEPVKSKPAWDVVGEYKIVDIDGELFLETTCDGIDWRLDIRTLYSGFQPQDLVTIKGVSDTKCLN